MSSRDRPTIAIFGCGYLGRRVARQCTERGMQVIPVTRNPSTAENFSKEGWQPVVADITDPVSLDHAIDEFRDVDYVLFAVGFDRAAGMPIEEVYVGGLQNVLQRLPEFSQPHQRFIYISSTGVYGQKQGEWVDEDSPCEPERVGGKACLSAEKALIKSRFANSSILLRFAGIYGPGRLPRKKDILQDRTITAATSGFLNLIHVDDGVLVVMASFRADAPARYVVSDGHPVPRGDYYRELARQLGVDDLKILEIDSESPAGQRARASKRIRSDRFRDRLGVKLKYVDYRAGLRQALRVEGTATQP